MKTNYMYLILICLVSAMGGLLFGYDWVVIGGAKIFYEPFFHIEQSASLRGWAMSSALIGCLAGALMSGRWSDKYGRKKMLIAASVLFVLSAYGTGATDNFTMFIIYRIVGGLGIGIASNVSPVYIAEVSPSRYRGRLVSLNQLFVVIGILSAQIVNWRIGSHFSDGSGIISSEGVEMAWRFMFWAELVPAVLFFVFSFIIPESPRWLVSAGYGEKAVKIFRKIGGDGFAASTMEEISSGATSSSENVRGGWRTIFQPGMRNVLVIGAVLAILQQWCGINVIFNYAHEIFSEAGYAVSDVLMNIVVTGVTNLVFTLVALFTVDRVGRRTLMLAGSLALAVIYAILGGCYHFGVSGLPMLVLVVLAIASYAMSFAAVVWVVLSEIFPVRVRGVAMAFSTFCLWSACFILTYTFPVLNVSLGAAGTFWIYGIICLGGFIFVFRKVPETKGKSLEEIEKQLVK